MDGLHLFFQRLVDQAVPSEERLPFKARRSDLHSELAAATVRRVHHALREPQLSERCAQGLQQRTTSVACSRSLSTASSSAALGIQALAEQAGAAAFAHHGEDNRKRRGDARWLQRVVFWTMTYDVRRHPDVLARPVYWLRAVASGVWRSEPHEEPLRWHMLSALRAPAGPRHAGRTQQALPGSLRRRGAGRRAVADGARRRAARTVSMASPVQLLGQSFNGAGVRLFLGVVLVRPGRPGRCVCVCAACWPMRSAR